MDHRSSGPSSESEVPDVVDPGSVIRVVLDPETVHLSVGLPPCNPPLSLSVNESWMNRFLTRPQGYPDNTDNSG